MRLFEGGNYFKSYHEQTIHNKSSLTNLFKTNFRTQLMLLFTLRANTEMFLMDFQGGCFIRGCVLNYFLGIQDN